MGFISCPNGTRKKHDHAQGSRVFEEAGERLSRNMAETELTNLIVDQQHRGWKKVGNHRGVHHWLLIWLLLLNYWGHTPFGHTICHVLLWFSTCFKVEWSLFTACLLLQVFGFAGKDAVSGYEAWRILVPTFGVATAAVGLWAWKTRPTLAEGLLDTWKRSFSRCLTWLGLEEKFRLTWLGRRWRSQNNRNCLRRTHQPY